MKPDIGMYCYDKCNRKIGIGKIDEFRKNNNVVVQYKNFLVLVSVGNVVASFNIIDLIETNDFINEMQVSEIIEKTNEYIKFMADSDYEFATTLYREEIYSVLTYEQFGHYMFRLEDKQ